MLGETDVSVNLDGVIRVKLIEVGGATAKAGCVTDTRER